MGEEGDPFKTRPSKKYDKAMTSGERNTVSVESPWVRLVSVTSDDDITISVESPPAPPPTSPPAPMTTGSSSMEAAVHAYVPVTSEIKVTLHKVPHRLREVNEKAYEPNVISIGPYHHGKPHLAAMEVIKQRFFWEISDKTEIGINGFRNAMRPLEKEARMCYEEPLPRKLESGQQFLDMMIYDGCFVVNQILMGFGRSIFEAGYIQTDILGTDGEIDNDEGDIMYLKKSALCFFETSLSPPTGKHIHLLDLVHSTYLPSPQGITRHQKYTSGQGSDSSSSESMRKFIRSATELEAAGINFFGDHVTNMNNVEKGIKGMFDIEFTTCTNRGIKHLCDILTFRTSTKVLRIPTLRVDDSTERILRNYMAYEQFFPIHKPTYCVDYVIFMDNLVNTGEDVQLLCESGVIDNRLGDYEAVAQMFNKLREHIYMSRDLYYAEIFDGVNEHCRIKWNKWKASLKKDYFNTPWSLLSFFAAVLLLLLTLLQTIFTILSYYKERD
ncbi:hypothetical protein V6N13_046610 [Hibiscus sabdariffa]